MDFNENFISGGGMFIYMVGLTMILINDETADGASVNL